MPAGHHRNQQLMETLMRSLLAARSARLVLAAAAVAALAATTTACGPSTSNGASSSDAGSSANPAADASAGSSPSPGASADSSGSDTSATGGSDTGDSTPGSGGSTEQAVNTDDAKKDYYGQACGTNDLTFTVSEKTQAGGYFLIAAKAKPGITCELDGTIPDVSFGSAADTKASNAEQAVTGTVKLSGSTVAYAGVNPKSTNTDYGKELGQLIVAITGFESDAVQLKISNTLVDKPVTTNWHANAADAVPSLG
jgi:hypothetical protein